MATIKGIDFIASINTGTNELPVWTKVGGQRGATLDRSIETMETTSKDSEGFKEFEAGFTEWSIEADGLYIVDDKGFEALEEAFMAKDKLKVQVATPSGVSYEGLTILTALPIEMPYDDVVTYSVTFQGSGKLERKKAE